MKCLIHDLFLLKFIDYLYKIDLLIFISLVIFFCEFVINKRKQLLKQIIELFS